jgi:metal-responsive CopG/Arc/MetJ family transcriptional regulator
VAIIYHIIIYFRVMAKKVAISITIDGDVLRELDASLREIQSAQLRSRKPLETRSSLVERLIREGISREKPKR